MMTTWVKFVGGEGKKARPNSYIILSKMSQSSIVRVAHGLNGMFFTNCHDCRGIATRSLAVKMQLRNKGWPWDGVIHVTL